MIKIAKNEIGLSSNDLVYCVMISTPRRSPNATLVTKTAIDQASEALQNLPEKTKEKLSLREAVDVLRDHITAALDKGYSYEDIAVMLAKQGVSIAPSSLKHYLARSNRQLKKATGTQTRRRRSTAKSPDLETEDDLSELPSVEDLDDELEDDEDLDDELEDDEDLDDEADDDEDLEEDELEPEPAPRRGRRPANSVEPTVKTTTRSTSSRTKPVTSSTRKRRGQTLS